MINHSKDLGVVPPVVTPSDIMKGNSKVNSVFVAQIFNTYYELAPDEETKDEPLADPSAGRKTEIVINPSDGFSQDAIDGRKVQTEKNKCESDSDENSDDS